MPINRTFTGVWSVGWDLYAKLIVICDSINQQYNLSVSPANVMGGSGNMLIKDIGNIDSKISVRGPLLFSSKGYTANLGMNLPSGANGILDAYGYSQYITRKTWDNISTALTSDTLLIGDTILDSVEMSISQQGANVNTSWYLDFLADNPGGQGSTPYPNQNNGEGGGTSARSGNQSGELWLTEGFLGSPNNLIPLRKGQWYDFLVKLVGNGNDSYLVIKEFKATLRPEYENYNPVGGYIHPVSKQRVWSNPIKILKGVSLIYDLTTLIPVNQGYPGWGRANLNYYTNGGGISSWTTRVDTQPANQFSYVNGSDIQVDFLYSGAASGSFPNYGIDIVDALMVNSSNKSLNRVGHLNKGISNNLVPGLCEGRGTYEFLLSP